MTGHRTALPAHLSECNRLEAFSDGVFAIAITLLIIEIKVPGEAAVHEARGLGGALLQLWPSYLGYAISFITLGIMWINHHAMLRYFRAVDRRFLLAHVPFLMGIAFVPFPTAVLAEHLPHAETRVTATAFYGLSLFLIALLYNAVWWAGHSRPELLDTDCTDEGVRTITRRYAEGPPSYLVATGLAFIHVGASLAVHAALSLMFALSERRGPASAAPVKES